MSYAATLLNIVYPEDEQKQKQGKAEVSKWLRPELTETPTALAEELLAAAAIVQFRGEVELDSHIITSRNSLQHALTAWRLFQEIPEKAEQRRPSSVDPLPRLAYDIRNPRGPLLQGASTVLLVHKDCHSQHWA